MGNGFSGIIICTIRIVCLLVIKENVGTSNKYMNNKVLSYTFVVLP